MRHWGRLLACLAWLFFGATMAAQADEANGGSALALVVVEPSESGLEIVGRALAIVTGTVSGEMVIDRRGASGTVSTRQGREIELKAGQTGDIARVGVSFEPGDVLDVSVILSKNGNEIARSSLTTSGN